MNEVTKAILEHKYKDAAMKKQVFIARRSKNNRIQSKVFTKLFYAFMEEKPVSVVAKIVSRNGKYYAVFNRLENDLSRIDKRIAENLDD